MPSTAQPSKFLNVSLKSPTLPLLLRTPSLADAPAIHALLSKPGNTSMDNPESKAVTPPSLEDIQFRIATWRAAAAEECPGRLNLVVVDCITDRVEGLSGFGHIATHKNGTRCGNVGIMLNQEARGKGYGAEAVRLSVEWGFADCRFGEESVGTLERNIGMMRIIEKVLLPRGWKGERRMLESGEWGWEFKISNDTWEDGQKQGRDSIVGRSIMKS